MARRREAEKTAQDLLNLRRLSTTPPQTKIGLVLWAWPEIQASLKSGRRMHEIWEALQLDGLEMSYGQFRTYVWRIRKRTSGSTAGQPQAEMPSATPAPVSSAPATNPTESPMQVPDPLANIRRELEKKRNSGFVYDPAVDTRE
jgi:hypothetical protein